MNKKEKRRARQMIRRVSKRLTRKDEQNKRIVESATSSIPKVLVNCHSSLRGLDEKEVLSSRSRFGANRVTKGRSKTVMQKLVDAFVNPFTVILFFLALVSSITDILFPHFELFGSGKEEVNCLTVVLIFTMVFLSGILRYVQETRSTKAAQKLLKMVTTTCTVTRKNQPGIEIPMEDLVVGDIVHLSAGDMIPADIRIIDAKDLFISQSSLTGESTPVEKTSLVCKDCGCAWMEYTNIGFMGSSVISGSATAVVISVGDHTTFGIMASAIVNDGEATGFTGGINAVTRVLIRFMLIMVPLVFLISGIAKGDWLSAFLFAISIAVGLIPEMLPMITTICLAKGAISMGKEKVIVKNLNSIHNLGAMDVLCLDKTGTLTQDQAVLEYHLNTDGREDTRVLRHAYLNSYFQTGYKNLMDTAIIQRTEALKEVDAQLADLSKQYEKVDEIPYDFNRRRLTTVVKDQKGKMQMVTKGAVEEMLSICSFVEAGEGILPLSGQKKKEILRSVRSWNKKGFRVLAIAQKRISTLEENFGAGEERDMVLIGYLAFLDPPKESAVDAIRALKAHGVSIKILTGDNEKVTKALCKQVGLDGRNIILGPDLIRISDADLAEAAEKTDIFAKLTPEQKSRVVSCLRAKGHTVGFMGDGINDAAAMRSADVGISVDSAADVAKESADIIMMKKDLTVLEKGIIEGRKTYANMIKYIKITAASNFGNVFAVLVASALLPFLPMTGLQLIFLNLIYDITCVAIPWDNVDEEYLREPRKWEGTSLAGFMLWMGPLSSIFDWATYLFLYFVLCPLFTSKGCLFHELAGHFSGEELQMIRGNYIAMFQAGWFVESMWSQTFVLHLLRTQKVSFFESHASMPLTILTFAGILILTGIPFTALGSRLGFVALPAVYFAYLIPCILLYMILVTIWKRIYARYYQFIV